MKTQRYDAMTTGRNGEIFLQTVTAATKAAALETRGVWEPGEVRIVRLAPPLRGTDVDALRDYFG